LASILALQSPTPRTKAPCEAALKMPLEYQASPQSRVSESTRMNEKLNSSIVNTVEIKSNS
jgi:hypothetical protein